jgi:hypothetical protein
MQNGAEISPNGAVQAHVQEAAAGAGHEADQPQITAEHSADSESSPGSAHASGTSGHRSANSRSPPRQSAAPRRMVPPLPSAGPLHPPPLTRQATRRLPHRGQAGPALHKTTRLRQQDPLHLDVQGDLEQDPEQTDPLCRYLLQHNLRLPTEQDQKPVISNQNFTSMVLFVMDYPAHLMNLKVCK